MAFQSVTDIVEQFGIALIDSQAGAEDGLFGFPVKVADISLRSVKNKKQQDGQVE